MTAAKPPATIERFNPKARPQRAAQTERAYRVMMQERLLDLLRVMNPQDQIHFGAMNYEELVEYAFDWLKTELEEVGPNPLRGLESEEPKPLSL